MTKDLMPIYHHRLSPYMSEVANKFRELKSKSNGDILKALMSAEGQAFVRSYFESSPECIKPNPKSKDQSDDSLDLFER